MEIEKPTELQICAMSEVADAWLAHGLTTGPADRTEAEAGVADAYRAAGLEPPRTFVCRASPLAGALGAWVLGAKMLGARHGHDHRGGAGRLPLNGEDAPRGCEFAGRLFSGRQGQALLAFR
ncbi:hypothetical protein O3S80_18675 [Streptomyces sp. Lzd4kr]|nr:hypothetical protein [Streptomyces sp. Lzd4kr]